MLVLFCVVAPADSAFAEIVSGYVYEGTCASGPSAPRSECQRLHFDGANASHVDRFVTAQEGGRYEVDLPVGWTGKIIADTHPNCSSLLRGFSVFGSGQCTQNTEYSFVMGNQPLFLDIWANAWPTKTISGTIKDCNNQNLNGILVVASGGCLGSPLTNHSVNGTWSITVPCGWYGTVEPVDDDLTFPAWVIPSAGAIFSNTTHAFQGSYDTPVPVVVEPSANDTIAVLRNMLIDWQDTPGATENRVEISRNGGPWTLITTTAGNVSQHTWFTQPPAAGNCRIRVTSTYPQACGPISDESDAFALINGLEFTFPTPGLTFDPTTTQNITWNACNDCGFTKFTLAYSHNGVSNWQTIALDMDPSYRSYPWSVSDTVTTNGKFKMYVEEGAYISHDVFSPTFSIDCFSFNLTQPVAGTKAKEIGSNLHFGSQVVGTPCSPITTYKYLFSRDGGASWDTVGTNGTGFFSWTITGPPSNNCKGRIVARNYFEQEVKTSGSFPIANPEPPDPELPPGAALGSIVPARTRLVGSLPNPFRPSTIIRFDLAKPARTRIEIVDVKGQRVRMVDLGLRDAEQGSWAWDGRDDAGRQVGSAVYYVRFFADDFTDRMRITKLR